MDPHPEQGAVPWLDFWAVARAFHWSWQEYLATPEDVTEWVLLIEDVARGVEQMKMREAAKGPAKGKP